MGGVDGGRADRPWRWSRWGGEGAGSVKLTVLRMAAVPHTEANRIPGMGILFGVCLCFKSL